MLERRGDYAFPYRLHDGVGEIAAQWHFFGESQLPVAVQTWTVPPGGTEGMHAHGDGDAPIEELYLVTRGNARMCVGDRTYDVGPGDAVLAHPGVDHNLVNTGDDDLTVVVIWGPQGQVDQSGYRMARLAGEART